MKHLTLGIFAVILVLNLAQADDGGRTLRIGVIQSLTGMAADDGNSIVNALEVTADTLKAGGISLELVVEDDASDAKHAVSAFRRLVANGVDAIIGGTWSFLAAPLIPLAGQTKVLFVNTSNFPESLDLGRGAKCAYVVSAGVRDDAAPFDTFLAQLKPQTLSLIYVGAPWGEIQRIEYQRLLAARQIRLVSEESPPLVDQNDWSSIVAKTRAAAPQAIALIVNKADVGLFLKKARNLKLEVPIFAAMSAYDALRDAGSPEVFNGIFFTYPYEALMRDSDFYRAYSARYKSEPRIYANSSSLGLRLIAEALLGPGTNEQGACAKFDRIYREKAGTGLRLESTFMTVSDSHAMAVAVQQTAAPDGRP